MLLGNSVFINVQFLKSLRTKNPQRARIHFPQSVNAVAFLPDFSLYQTPPTSVCLGALQIPNSNWWKAARLPDRASGQAPRRVWHKAYGGAGEREGRLRSPPGGRPASPEPAPRRERDPRRPPTPLRAARSEPGRAADGEPGRPRWLHRDGSTAPTRALRGASEVWTRKYMGRPSACSHARAGLRSTLLTCWTRTRAHPPPLHPAPLTSTASWSRRPGACHFQREPGLRARGIPGMGVRAAWARAARPEPCVRRRLAHTCPPPLPAASLAARAQRARLNLPFIPGPGVRAPPPRDSARRVPRRGHAPAPPQPPPPSQARPRGLWARTGRTAPLSSWRLWAWACGLFSSRLSRAPWVALSTSDGDSPRWFPQPRARCGELRGGLAIGERLGRRRGMLGTHRIKKVRVTPPNRRTWRPLCLIRCVLDPKFRRLTDDQIRSRKVRGQIRGCACGPGVACHVSPDNFVVFSCHSILARMVSRLQSSCEFTVGGNWLIKSDSVFQQIKQGLFRTKSTGFVSKLKL